MTLGAAQEFEKILEAFFRSNLRALLVSAEDQTELLPLPSKFNRAVLEVRPESAEAFREIAHLSNKAMLEPTVIVISEIERVLTPALICILLASIEEPAVGIQYLFLTSSMYSLPRTFRARCCEFNLSSSGAQVCRSDLNDTLTRFVAHSDDSILQDFSDLAADLSGIQNICSKIDARHKSLRHARQFHQESFFA